jgi:hypothetical protein
MIVVESNHARYRTTFAVLGIAAAIASQRLHEAAPATT